jgi:hypothetical protein
VLEPKQKEKNKVVAIGSQGNVIKEEKEVFSGLWGKGINWNKPNSQLMNGDCFKDRRKLIYFKGIKTVKSMMSLVSICIQAVSNNIQNFIQENKIPGTFSLFSLFY